MSRYVVDASVAVEYLLRTPLGLSAADMIEGASLAAAELMHAEVLSVLSVLKGRRGAVLSAGVSPVGYLQEARAQMVIDDLSHWPVDRISHRSLATLRLGATTGTSAPTMPSTSQPPAPTGSLS